MIHNNQTQPRNSAVSPLSLPPIERKTGNTTYIVTARFNPNAREGLLGKLWRLIQNDAD